jgi:hypothetical protein
MILRLHPFPRRSRSTMCGSAWHPDRGTSRCVTIRSAGLKMSRVASLLIDDRSVTVSLSAAEKIEALHGNVTVPRTAVIGARGVPDGMAEVHGMRTGTGLPGVILVGTVRDSDSVTFAVCHGRRPAVVLDLAGQSYDRIVVTVENPEEIISRLR